MHYGRAGISGIPSISFSLTLSEAACVDDGFVLCLDVHQHLVDYNGGERHIDKGQVGEEVLRHVQMGVSADGQDHEQAPQHGDHLGTWPGRAQRERAAVLGPLRAPGGGSLLRLFGFLIPCY